MKLGPGARGKTGAAGTASTHTTEFAFKRQGDQTEVTWSMVGEKCFIAKAMCLFVSINKEIGADFDKGLAQLKLAVEAANTKVAAP